MPKTFVDVEDVVRNWAWRLYDRTATRKQKKLRQKEKRKNSTYIKVTLDWSDVKFHDETTWTNLVNDDDEADSNNNSNNNQKQQSPSCCGDTALGMYKTISSDVCVLFQTKFTNNTEDPQEYTMRTEKTTKSSCSTSVETGYTKGMNLGVTLKTPCEVLEASAGFHREFSLTNSDGQTFEEELTWGVESVIKVKAEHVAEAQLVVKERKQSGDFTITSKISGTVYVTFTNVRDNNSFLKATGGDIVTIFRQYLEIERRKGEVTILKQNFEMKCRKGESLEFVTINDEVVTISTKGSLSSVMEYNKKLK